VVLYFGLQILPVEPVLTGRSSGSEASRQLGSPRFSCNSIVVPLMSFQQHRRPVDAVDDGVSGGRVAFPRLG
jgi:hypothetical protein